VNPGPKLAVTLVAILSTAVVSPAVAGVDLTPSTAEVDADGDTRIDTSPDDEPVRIVAILPNPVEYGDRGEYVVLSFPDRTNLSGWSVSDGEDRIDLPGRTVNGRVLVTPNPGLVRNATPARRSEDTDAVVSGSGDLSLSNAGETVELVYRNVTVDALTYADAPEGERYHRDGWRPVGATDRPVGVHQARAVRAFALPDDPGVPVEVFRSADRRILVAGYSFTSRRIARVLRRASERGVRVRVLVDDSPVGGMSRREARLLDSLVAAGVDVRAFGGERAPYAFHHPKYAVVDDRAMVLTENYKPAGTGGRSSRGWGAVIDSPDVAADLEGIFRADARSLNARPWERARENASLRSRGVADGTYPTRFRPRRFDVERVRVLAAPDNAERAVVDLLANATESIRIQQVSIDRGPFLRATVAAARRGVSVRILVSGAWYVREDNRELVERLGKRSRREGLDLRARLARPRSRFEKVHAKGVVVDGERAVVGSLNWNNHSARENREVAVVLDGERAAGYYADVFLADWRGGLWWIPAGIVAATVVAVAGALAVGRRRIRFAGEKREGVAPDDEPRSNP